MKECPVCRRCFPDHVNHCPDDGDATTQSIAGEPTLDGRYQLERRIGHGGMGVVFQARHIFLKTAHAIKIILPDLVGNDPMLVTRFRQEALAAAAIRHQNIIAVTDFGVVRGTMPFLVMEFVSGRSLHDMLAEEGALPPARALEIISAIGAGVSAAHRQGIIHRDLKPLNVMFQEGLPTAEAVKVLDFGLAKIKSGELLGSFVQAKTSGLMGSPFYMAPEQWGDEEPNARADIYSLGVILYQMLGGDVPFKGTSIPSIMKKHLTESPAPLASLGVQVPAQIEAVVRHALEKEPENRPASVEEFIRELRDAVASVSASLNSTLVSSANAPTIIASHGAVSIPPDATTLRINTNPPNSRVYINNVSVGMTDNAGKLVVPDMLRGTHRVQILHDGFAEWSRQVECTGGFCDLNAQLQSLMETSVPQASVFGHQSIEDHRRAEEEARLAAEAEAKRKAEEEAARQKAVEEARLRAKEEEEKQQAEEAARKRAEEEERLRLEAEAKRKAEEEAARVRAEEESRIRAEAEAKRKAEEEAERRRAEEARLLAEAEAAKKLAEEKVAREREEAERRQREENERKRAEEHERAVAEEGERAAREQKEREEQAARIASSMQSGPLSEVNLESTLSQRQGVITQPVDEESLRESEQSAGAWSGQRASQQGQPFARQGQAAFQNSGAVIAKPQRSGVSTTLIAAIVGVVLIGSGIGVWYMLSARSNTNNINSNAINTNKENSNANNANNVNNANNTNNNKGENPPPPPQLIQIPGGTMEMGRDDGAPTEGPKHLVVVHSFAMDRTEVTNAEYAQFVSETHHQPPSNWAGDKPYQGGEMLPVVNVSYEDAVEFAKWRSKRDHVTYRLPTEEEWEYSARGGDQSNLYPWGSAWVQGRAGVKDSGAIGPKPVGSYPEDKSRWGVLDMAGNVYEWTSSKASMYPGSQLVIKPEQKNWIIVRGAAYVTDYKQKNPTTFRDWFPPTTKEPVIGFRLVRAG
ncbi:MAG: hypothetical protein DMF68_00340 [Acidobacteria bacterium]|nr:MAG: hypothetical protein DMF68_00340 [Acidobacteriota bacterium]